MDTNTALTQKHCQPCEGIGQALDKKTATQLLKNVPGWQMDEEGKVIRREYPMKDFKTAINFMSKVAVIAESENHHPDLHLTGYRKLKIELSTHALGGLSQNDFIIAAKINALPVELKP
ncbi:MAG TPA: pterin-4-alpha-carbinolamine dehydratase [Candidatus Omnitrophica bacterium]|nr:MAG: pterin-4-alpha-carbinolamine dehydratase [Omnitrophica WOR_2 bacterium GWA2_45_18]OGX21033.1 MAG: pterin-4-alpha-carbinolamine dehydratase [Omnitrophica WOR_2 bacterium GWC2_45_7]HBR15885.1 pterin-4-alpha-carbinolamine dehydratase [Candidatus Omnitrophota bacterium]